MQTFLHILFYTVIYAIIGTLTGLVGIRVLIWTDVTDARDIRDDAEFAAGMFALWVLFWPLGTAAAILFGIGFGFFLLFRLAITKSLPSG